MRNTRSVLKLHSSIYPAAAVRKAAADFESVASVSLKRDGPYIVVTFVSCQPPHDMRTATHMFATYALMRAQSTP